MKYGIDLKKSINEVQVTRTTKETKISVSINSIKGKTLDVNTSIPFLNHMIETLGWRANLNIGVKILFKVDLEHTITEDIGISLGCAILELFKMKMSKGLEGFGFAKGIIDEARAEVILSIEGRVSCFTRGPKFENIDGISSYCLVAFLKGFCQGNRCTLHLNYSGEDPHHTWEAIFRALGYAIQNIFQENEWRKGTISAMKGTLD
ncbi:MAG: hypothetical protein JSU91_03310 [Thermoplasmatales archaeon]|nr:MAG: hypothetical protein JSU91_03310 [Thermoplasmatales archaeon]